MLEKNMGEWKLSETEGFKTKTVKLYEIYNGDEVVVDFSTDHRKDLKLPTEITVFKITHITNFHDRYFMMDDCGMTYSVLKSDLQEIEIVVKRFKLNKEEVE